MRDHLKDNWGFYAFFIGLAGLLWLVTAVDSEQDRRIAYCFDRGSVLVKTDAGPRCAPLYSLEKVR